MNWKNKTFDSSLLSLCTIYFRLYKILIKVRSILNFLAFDKCCIKVYTQDYITIRSTSSYFDVELISPLLIRNEIWLDTFNYRKIIKSINKLHSFNLINNRTLFHYTYFHMYLHFFVVALNITKIYFHYVVAVINDKNFC